MVDQENFRFIEVKVRVVHYALRFIKPARTSRDTLTARDVWFIVLSDNEGKMGIGECAPIFGLSRETKEQVQNALNELLLATTLQEAIAKAAPLSSVTAAMEMAILDLIGNGIASGLGLSSKLEIAINGLVWMNQKKEMLEEALTKIDQGYKCIKFKIGGILFQDELEIISTIRTHYPKSYQIQIRLDANGAFGKEDVFWKLDELSKFDIHSIEQPIRPGNFSLMKEVIQSSEIPIAFDEELISINENKWEFLNRLQPDYLVLKPTLQGGFGNCDAWIENAEKLNIGWWVTSALESNIGLNAIAHWVQRKNAKGYQGLGTGLLYSNNIPSPLEIKDGLLISNSEIGWDITNILQPLEFRKD